MFIGCAPSGFWSAFGMPALRVTFRLWRVTDRSHICLLLTGNTPVKANSMASAANALSFSANAQTPPRERILAAASDLFYRHGIRAVGVEAIAEAAETNKMTLYRHFPSKDELVAEYLRCQIEPGKKVWDELAARYPGDPRAQLRGWLEYKATAVASAEERGCPYANAAVEFP